MFTSDHVVPFNEGFTVRIPNNVEMNEERFREIINNDEDVLRLCARDLVTQMKEFRGWDLYRVNTDHILVVYYAPIQILDVEQYEDHHRTLREALAMYMKGED